MATLEQHVKRGKAAGKTPKADSKDLDKMARKGQTESPKKLQDATAHGKGRKGC